MGCLWYLFDFLKTSEFWGYLFEVKNDLRNIGPSYGIFLPTISNESFGCEIQVLGYFGSGLLVTEPVFTLFKGLFSVDSVFGDHFVEDHAKWVDIGLFSGLNGYVVFIGKDFGRRVHALIGITGDEAQILLETE